MENVAFHFSQKFPIHLGYLLPISFKNAQSGHTVCKLKAVLACQKNGSINVHGDKIDYVGFMST